MDLEAEVAVVREVQNNSLHFDTVHCYSIPYEVEVFG